MSGTELGRGVPVRVVFGALVSADPGGFDTRGGRGFCGAGTLGMLPIALDRLRCLGRLGCSATLGSPRVGA